MKGIRGYTALFSLLGLLLAGRIWAADEFATLRKSAENIKTLRTDFILEKHLRIMTKPLISQGRLYYKAPRSIRWEYLSPVKHLMLMDTSGARTYVWLEGKWVLDRTQSEARAIVMDEMNRWLTGRFNENASFHFTYKPGPPPSVILTPKEEMKHFMSQIVFSFSPATGLVRTVEISEDQGNRTKITFRNEKSDVELDDSLFAAP